jgi:hypothetical protein
MRWMARWVMSRAENVRHSQRVTFSKRTTQRITKRTFFQMEVPE